MDVVDVGVDGGAVVAGPPTTTVVVVEAIVGGGGLDVATLTGSEERRWTGASVCSRRHDGATTAADPTSARATMTPVVRRRSPICRRAQRAAGTMTTRPPRASIASRMIALASLAAALSESRTSSAVMTRSSSSCICRRTTNPTYASAPAAIVTARITSAINMARSPRRTTLLRAAFSGQVPRVGGACGLARTAREPATMERVAVSTLPIGERLTGPTEHQTLYAALGCDLFQGPVLSPFPWHPTQPRIAEERAVLSMYGSTSIAEKEKRLHLGSSFRLAGVVCVDLCVRAPEPDQLTQGLPCWVARRACPWMIDVAEEFSEDRIGDIVLIEPNLKRSEQLIAELHRHPVPLADAGFEGAEDLGQLGSHFVFVVQVVHGSVPWLPAGGYRSTPPHSVVC